MFDLNAVGTMLPCQVFGRKMAEHKEGVILNVSSMSAIRPLTRIPGYSAAKAAVSNFTQWLAVHMAHEYSPDIRVNAIAPGKADSAFRAQIKENKAEMLKAEDHVGICIFLASNESQYINGQVIPIVWYGPEATME